eukprot:10345381-Alexandrium_andersonii.AAC.1
MAGPASRRSVGMHTTPQGRAASERPRSTVPRYFLVHPHVTARLPPPGEVPAFNDEAYGSPE